MRKYVKDLEIGDVFTYLDVDYKLTEKRDYNRQSKADQLNGFGSILLDDFTSVEVVGKIAKVSEFLDKPSRNFKQLKNIPCGSKFLCNGIRYRLENSIFNSLNNSYKFEIFNLNLGIKEIFVNPILEVELIEDETPFNKVGKMVYKEKTPEQKRIDDIVNNSPDKKLKLYLGCFNKPIPGFVNVDIRPYPETLCDITDDILKLEKFEDNSVDTILSVHTLEHVGRYEYMDALKVWFSKLKKNGICYISVPDMQAVCEHYIYHHDLSFLYSFIWGSQKHEADKHFCGFDFDLLKKSLEEVGFGNVERYDWTKTPWAYIDSYAGAYAKHLDRNSRLMSLNVKATKL